MPKLEGLPNAEPPLVAADPKADGVPKADGWLADEPKADVLPNAEGCEKEGCPNVAAVGTGRVAKRRVQHVITGKRA